MYDNFVFFVFILLCLTIVKDVLVLFNKAENWLRRKLNGEKLQDLPPSARVVNVLLQEYSENTTRTILDSFDKHFQAVMMENKKTNELLSKFLYGQKIIAKNVHGIDLDV